MIGESQLLTDPVSQKGKSVEFHILVVEDNHSDYRLLERSINRSDLSCLLSWAATAEEALSLLPVHKFDVVLLDYLLPDSTGLALYKEMVSSGYDLPVIFVTAMGNEQAAVEAFKLGAQDYVIKDGSGEYLNLLPFIIRKGYRQWEDGRMRRETESALRELNANLEKKIDERTGEIREREALTRAILGSLEPHIAVLDKDGIIIAVNTAWEQYSSENGDPMGIRAEIGNNYLEITRVAAEEGDDYALRALNGLQAVLNGLESYFSLEYPCHTPHETEWFVLNITSLKSESGGVVMAHTDITDRRKIYDREKEQRLRAETLQEITRFLNHSLNLENVLEGILEQLARVVDYHSANVMLVEGDRLDIVAYQNKEGKPQTIKTIQFEHLPHVKQALKEQTAVYLADTNEDSRWKSFSGSDFIRCWVGIPLVVQDRTIGLLNLNHIRPNAYPDKLMSTAVAFANQAAIAIENARLYRQATREIEERKRVEMALEAERTTLSQRVSERTAELTKTNHKLSQAMQAKDQFLANMSHELRTPLTAILGKTEVLQEGIYGSLTEKQIQAVKVIDLSGIHLLALINDILDVARIEAGQLELDWEIVALQSLCEASIQLVTSEASKKGITIQRQFDERIKTIQADSRRLKQILVNLLSNAVKFTPEGGKVGLEVYGDFANEFVKIMVWDTGIGISEEGKRKLFGDMNRPKPFVQLENTLSRQYPGSGLGLVLVYALTEMHNGSLRIESTAGLGTRITVSLPLITPYTQSDNPANAAGEILENIPLQERQSGKVLLGEDNFYTIEGLVDYLAHLGFEVFVANDGERVVEKAAEIHPDLILMDIQLPKRDGLEAIKIIRNELGLGEVPIIALTALTMPGDRERCLAAGANEFISKPFNVRHVTEVIRRLGAIRS